MNNSIIITGASRGIGKAIALDVAENSSSNNINHFFLIARDKAKLKETAKEIKTRHKDAKTFIFATDFSSLKHLEKTIQSIIPHIIGKIYLINNAGYTEPASIIETSNENLIKTFTVNTMAPILIVRELLKGEVNLKKIVNVASTAGMSPRPGWVSYAGSKAAVINVTETMNEELTSKGIDVFSISPGRCATDLRKTLAPEEDQSKIMQPEEVARVVSNLISESAAIMSGQNIVLRKPIIV
ncbi:MAG: SDR family oxidoreductase [Spirochaetales bacterium]|nr:SDR family oxidoreductase [Spirochaetales bacterium]